MRSGRDRILDGRRSGGFGFLVATAPRLDTGSGAPRARLMSRTLFQTAVFVTLMVIYFVGVPLGGADATLAACAAILLVGLPHGALDLEIIKGDRGTGPAGMVAVLMLYLGLAAAMMAIWSSAPVAALAIFIVVAVVHFAEDWRELRSAFLAQGMAIALLTAPALLHLTELERLFVALSGQSEAALVANIMLLLAPVSIAVASVSLWTLWHGGSRDQAAVGVLTLAGMIVLPPVIGFALFFCLYHSPHHFALATARVGAGSRARWVVLFVSLAALGIAVALFASEMRGGVTAQAVAASFMTLSLLTVPHMIVPAIASAIAARRAGLAGACGATAR